jgi:type IV secretion system protein VirB10
LGLINSISTKGSREGDLIYLTTLMPVVIGGRIVIPPGSYVNGTITSSVRPGRVKGRGELYIRFDSLTLPNGTTRDLRSRLGQSDANAEVDREEGKIKGEGGKGKDAGTVAQTTAAGASVGGLAGAIGRHPGMGVGIGAAAGAAAGLAGVLLSRGPDVTLPKGTTVEMVLDRDLQYEEKELMPR